MSGQVDTQRARAFAEAALAAMARHNVPPSPRNYTVWYTHVAGENPELSRTLEILISNGQEFTDAQNEHLYQQFFVSDVEAIDLISAGARLDKQIAQVLAQLGVA